MPSLIDLRGELFGRLTVLERTSDRSHGAQWICKCDCGAQTVVLSYNLRSGHTRSCGCFSRERSTDHGYYGTRTYEVWFRMKSRCDDKKSPQYPDYGGRGIAYDPRWTSFEAFLEDMGERPPGLSIDRMDNDGNYTKENCRWATQKEQSRNKRNNRRITFNGRTQCLTDWAKELGFKTSTLLARLEELRWPIEKALTTPVRYWSRPPMPAARRCPPPAS